MITAVLFFKSLQNLTPTETTMSKAKTLKCQKILTSQTRNNI